MSFSGDVDKWADRAEEKLLLATRKIALGIFTEVVMMSPVDTGRFRGNWQCSINTIPIGTWDLEDPSGSIVLAEIQDMVSRLETFETIYLVNQLPYARRLEYGWSSQAPQGMVRIAVQRWTSIVNQVVAEVRRMP